MNLLFVSTGRYPDKQAAAIRHSIIAQGISANGHNVNFYLLSPQEWESSEISYNGVIFKTLNKYQGNNKILKLLSFIYALIKLKKKIKEVHNKSAVDGIVVYSINNLVIHTALSVSRKIRIKIFHERTELPYVVGKLDSFTGNIKYNYYINKLIPQFDGLFVISDKLREFFLPYNPKIEKILTLVDTNFFNIKSNPIYDFPYIAYCGTMKGNKDGVPILIKSFAKLLNDFPNHKLLLIGNNSDKSAINDTLNIIEQLGLQDKIVFTGLVEREIMPNLLGNAVLLAVSKPDNEQNSGNFPIKVGEYLSTSVPVIATKVGEIPNFIKDRENGFLAVPDSVESFYSKMHEALTDYDNARVIGLKGRELAKKVFDYKIQAEIMSEFIKRIN